MIHYIEADIERLGHYLEDIIRLHSECVETGGLVSFILPVSHVKISSHWREIYEEFRQKKNRTVFLALDEGELAGLVMLHKASVETQPHVAEVQKLLVFKKFRRRGIARQLLHTLEVEAVRQKRSLLLLDTNRDGPAENLYRQLGYVEAGIIPSYAILPDGSLCDGIIFYKNLRS